MQKKIISALAALIISNPAAATHAQEGTHQRSVESEIRTTIAEFVDAFNAGETNSLGAIVAEEYVDLTTPSTRMTREQFVSSIEQFKSAYDGTLEIIPRDILVSDNLAAEWGELRQTFTQRNGDGDENKIYMRYINLYAPDKDGKWRVIWGLERTMKDPLDVTAN